MDDLYSPEASRAARDEALALVTANGGDWVPKYFAGLKLIRGFVGTAEDIHVELHKLGLEKPHTHKIYGAATNAAVQRGRLRKTGEYRQMKKEKSHARETKVYLVK